MGFVAKHTKGYYDPSVDRTQMDGGTIDGGTIDDRRRVMPPQCRSVAASALCTLQLMAIVISIPARSRRLVMIHDTKEVVPAE